MLNTIDKAILLAIKIGGILSKEQNGFREGYFMVGAIKRAIDIVIKKEKSSM